MKSFVPILSGAVVFVSTTPSSHAFLAARSAVNYEFHHIRWGSSPHRKAEIVVAVGTRGVRRRILPRRRGEHPPWCGEFRVRRERGGVGLRRPRHYGQRLQQRGLQGEGLYPGACVAHLSGFDFSCNDEAIESVITVRLSLQKYLRETNMRK